MSAIDRCILKISDDVMEATSCAMLLSTTIAVKHSSDLCSVLCKYASLMGRGISTLLEAKSERSADKATMAWQSLKPATVVIVQAVEEARIRLDKASGMKAKAYTTQIDELFGDVMPTWEF